MSPTTLALAVAACGALSAAIACALWWAERRSARVSRKRAMLRRLEEAR